MRQGAVMPVAMGAVMGPMMLWMLHGALTGQGGGHAAAVFAALHVVALAVLVAVGVVLGRRVPALRRVLAHHGQRHLGLMLGSAAVAAALVHVIHGGPA